MRGENEKDSWFRYVVLLQCVFSYDTKRSHIFSATDNEPPTALLSEKKNTDHMRESNATDAVFLYFLVSIQ